MHRSQGFAAFLSCLAWAGHVWLSHASKQQLQRHAASDRMSMKAARSVQGDDSVHSREKYGKLAALAAVLSALNPEAPSRSLVPKAHDDALDAGRQETPEPTTPQSLAELSQSPQDYRLSTGPPFGQASVTPEITSLVPKAMEHIKAKNAPALRALLDDNGANVLCTLSDTEGRTMLHMAAATGDVEVVRVIIDAVLAHEAALGQPMAQIVAGPEFQRDIYGVMPAEYAFAAGSQAVFDFLVDSAVARPLEAKTGNAGDGTGREYLERRLKYDGDVLLDANGHGVMMGWETPLMKAHADMITPEPGSGQRVMNIGFGLGIVDGLLEDLRPGHHVIVEAHPDVQTEMARRGWTRRADVTVIFGRWQEVSDQMIANGPYDGIFFDTWAEVGQDLIHLFQLMPKLVKPGGRFSWFNGLSDSSIFAQAVQFRLQQMELAIQGFTCHYHALDFGDVGTAEWRKVSNKYWPGATYYLPIAVKVTDIDDSPDAHPNKGVATALRGLRAFKRLASMAEDGARVDAIRIGDDIGKDMKSKLMKAWWEDSQKGREMLGLDNRTPSQAFGKR